MKIEMRYNVIREKSREAGGCPCPSQEGATLLDEKERRARNMMIGDVIQLLILIVAVVALCYQVFRNKE